jgi:hypothetical protein
MLGVAAAVLASTAARAGTPYVVGDVFAATGNGRVKEFTPAGVLVQTLDDTTASTYTTGMCFDQSGNFFVTNISLTSVSKFDNSGNVIAANFLTGLTTPESCVLDTAGNIYVGEAHISQIKKFSSTGTLLATYTTPGGSDWIDLAADQCTMFYDDEGNAVHRFNVCTNTQLPDFATGLPGGHYALRILPSGGVIVAAGPQVQLLDSTGTVVSNYTAAGESLFFALNRDPNGTQFWTGGINTGIIYKYNFSPVGVPVTTFNSVPATLLAGLSIFGELVVGQPTPTPTGTGTVLPTVTPTTVPPTVTRTPTPGQAVVVPTLSFPMLVLLGLALVGAALFAITRR